MASSARTDSIATQAAARHEVAGVTFTAFERSAYPFGLRHTTELRPFVIDDTIVATGIPTGTSATVSVTAGFDTDTDPPDHDPGGDPPSNMI